tara:strand:+ start:20043 stop:20285 length:243 start_codon:yes stop_codon:yes gene_type:complete
MEYLNDEAARKALVTLEELLVSHQVIKVELLKVFKYPEAALEWLSHPKLPLENKSPASLLDSNPDAVLDMLYRIKTGDFS